MVGVEGSYAIGTTIDHLMRRTKGDGDQGGVHALDIARWTKDKLVPQIGFEPTTYPLGEGCSIP